MGGSRERLLGDLLAGLSVGLVLIPQSLAYAELAGLSPIHGLYASALPLLVAAPLVSSPYLQTGPVAVTSLLTFGALSALATPGSDRYVELALLLALVIGVVRIALGLLRAGTVAYLMSRPMLMGFIPAAALLIAGSQVPAVLGADAPAGGIVERALWAATHPGAWEVASLAFAAGALAAILLGRRLHRLFPGVLLAVLAALALSAATGYAGPRVGTIEAGLPPLSLALPWGETGGLLLAGAVIALVGFAEPASIARQYATEERTSWSANRELVSQGAANVAAAVSGGLPVGGSFSRSALNRLAGAHTRLSGAVTGLTVLAFLPFAGVLAPLPRAVLGAVVIAAVLSLLRVRPLLRLARVSKPQFAIAATTFAATLALTPHIERAILLGIGVSIAVHLWRELHVELSAWSEDGTLHLRPHGVLWFGAAQRLQDRFAERLAEHPRAGRLVLHLDHIGRLDATGALALRDVLDDARRSGVEASVEGFEPRDRRLVDGVVAQPYDPLAGPARRPVD